MDRSEHLNLVQQLTLPLNTTPNFKALAKSFGVSYDTVYSIYSQEVQARVIKAHHMLKTAMPKLAQRYLQGEDVLDICFEIDMPPCIVIRRLLEQLQLGLPRAKITEVLKEPSLLPSLISLETAAETLKLAHDTTNSSRNLSPEELISLLTVDVGRCAHCDPVYSPASDSIRHAAGLEYEDKLYSALKELKLHFWTEETLRTLGFHKTPDAKLQVPVAIDGHIVHWIDSKATFGDERMHKRQMEDQYQRYVNRFGPGMVIYWHGYVKELRKEGPRGVLISDCFPEKEGVLTLPMLDMAEEFKGSNRNDDAVLMYMRPRPGEEEEEVEIDEDELDVMLSV